MTKPVSKAKASKPAAKAAREGASKKRVGAPPFPKTQELLDFICEQIADGVTLVDICDKKKHPDRPSMSVVLGWLRDDPGFERTYARAREVSIDRMAEEITVIADDGRNDWMLDNDPDNPGYRFNGEHHQRSKLRLDARKWLLAKLRPSKYGEKLDLNHSGEIKLSDSEVDAKLALLLRKAGIAGAAAGEGDTKGEESSS